MSAGESDIPADEEQIQVLIPEKSSSFALLWNKLFKISSPSISRYHSSHVWKQMVLRFWQLCTDVRKLAVRGFTIYKTVGVSHRGHEMSFPVCN